MPDVGDTTANDPLAVTLVGAATEDNTLQASPSGPAGLAGAAPGDITYQWLRDGVAIAGAIGATYTLGQADVGRVITVQATFDGETAVSAGTGFVANVNDAPTGVVLIIGTAAETETLAADTTAEPKNSGSGSADS